MSQTTVKVQLQQRIDTSSNWTSAGTTVLLSGEIGWESDTKKYKIGDGSTAWSSLAYAPGAGGYTAGTGVAISASNVISASAIALSTIQTAANETAMLALTTQEGDVVVRSDQSKTYMKNNGTAGSMADFTELSTPTDSVTSVNGATGAITGLADLSGATFTGDVVFTGDAANVTWDKSTDDLIFNDNAKGIFGTSSDGLEIYHNGTGSYIQDSGTGKLYIGGSEVRITTAAISESIAHFIPDGAVELYYDNSKKFETTSDGVLVSGHLNLPDATVSTGRIRLGNSDDLMIYHDATDNYLVSDGGDLYIDTSAGHAFRIKTDQFIIKNAANNETLLSADNGSAVSLYYDNSKKFETVTGGATVTGTISAGSASFTDDGSSGPVINISGDDSGLWYGRIGNETYHDNVGTGFKFYVQDDGDALFTHYGNAEYRDWSIGSHDGTTSQYDIYRTAAGAVYLYNSGNVRLTTTAAGISVTGSVTDSTGELRTIVQNTQAGAYTLVAADAGKHILASGNITVPDSIFTAGQAITIVNNTGGDLTITKGTNMYNIADASNANRTLGTRGGCTLLFTAADTCYISGSPLS